MTRRLSAALAAITLLIFWVSVGNAQANVSFNTVSLQPEPDSLEPPVDFVESSPTIDGRLDDSLQFLPDRRFSSVFLPEGDSPISVSYRLAYGSQFFYLYLEAAADQLVFRDRAFQNGDGFYMVIGAPQPNRAPTSEFYVLACSAVKEQAQEWNRHIFWYYNVNRIFLPTSENTKLEFHQGEGKISFELLLPWNDVHPYHPWLSSGLGFNLAFVKAIGPDRVQRFKVIDDPRMDSEQSQRRYALLKFKPPVVHGAAQLFAQPRQGHIAAGDSLEIVAAAVGSGAGTMPLTARVLSGEGDPVVNRTTTVPFGSSVAVTRLQVNTVSLQPGGYRVRWKSGTGTEGERGLTILPTVDLADYGRRLSRTADRLPASSVSTLEFQLEELQQQLEAVYAYETCGSLRTGLGRLITAVEQVEEGQDPFRIATGYVRKAHRSKIDNSLQPYVVWLPADYSPSRKYPLMVFLHGSGSDETSFIRPSMKQLIPDGFIAVAPFARGTSHAYSADHAQEDIAEVIETVCRDYAIDSGSILLAGFSMGGYGVYRTAWEMPGRFAALAVFSGDPSLGTKYTGDSTQPNFSEPKNLGRFRNIPIFVFHGGKDLNCPYEITQRLVGELEKVDARVVFETEPEKGHELPGESVLQSYRAWVTNVFRDLH